MPKSFRSNSDSSTALGMPPMPSCSVAPSGISAATFRAMRFCTSLAGTGGSSSSGREVSTIAATLFTCRNVSPSVRGIWSLTSAMTWRAHNAPQKKAVVAEMPFVLRQGVIGAAEGQHVHDLDIAQLRRAAEQCLDKGDGRGVAFVNPDAVSRTNRFDGARGADDLVAELAGRLHGIPHLQVGLPELYCRL